MHVSLCLSAEDRVPSDNPCDIASYIAIIVVTRRLHSLTSLAAAPRLAPLARAPRPPGSKFRGQKGGGSILPSVYTYPSMKAMQLPRSREIL
jgi:hypothetical protein